MRLIFLVILFIAACTAMTLKKEEPLKNKLAPEYKVIDAAFEPLVNSYKHLAEKKNIKFTHNVTIGFTNIKHKDVVGICNYGSNFREIDIDRKYWNSITDKQKEALVFHELTHCYCLRKHDYGEGSLYPDAKTSKFAKSQKLDFFIIAPGYLVDGCPSSIMYPYVVGTKCMKKYEDYYLSEMFDRCKPY